MIGHCSPEAADGGPIALVADGDLIEIDVPARRLNLVGVDGVRKPPAEMAQILAERRAHWTPRPPKYTRGVMQLFCQLAASPMKGAYLDFGAKDHG